jgi:hypothetical protein
MDVWTAWMRRRARDCIATVLQLGTAAPRSIGVTKEEKEEGDNSDVTMTSAPRSAGPTGQLLSASAVGGRRRRVSRMLLGRKRRWACSLVGGPSGGLKVFLFFLNPINYLIQI